MTTTYTEDQFEVVCEVAHKLLPFIATNETNPTTVAKKAFGTAMAFVSELVRLDKELFPEYWAEQEAQDEVLSAIADEV